MSVASLGMGQRSERSARLGLADSVSVGSSLKFCLLARGEADFYPRFGRTMEWDTAAGHAVLAGAGGKVVRFDDHSALSVVPGDRTGTVAVVRVDGAEGGVHLRSVDHGCVCCVVF